MLDLGSGGGIDVLLSARRVGPTGKAYGLDMTDEMLALARENQRKAGATNVEFLKGTIEAIPLPDDSVDVIISNCVINLSSDKDAVLREAFRVLKPGGRFAVSDVIVRGDVPADVRRSMELWVGCIAGALEEHEYAVEAPGRRLHRRRGRAVARLQRRGRARLSDRDRPRRGRDRPRRQGPVRQRVRPREQARDNGLLRSGLLRMIRGALTLALLVGSAVSSNAQDPYVAFPQAYKKQFENDFVRVTRVHYAPHEKLTEHGHPGRPTVYVYLGDGGPVLFKHEHGVSGAMAATRPATKAGSYRIALGRDETHIVDNQSDLPSDFLQVELKTEIDPKTFNGRRFREPADTGEHSTKVEFDTSQSASYASPAAELRTALAPCRRRPRRRCRSRRAPVRRLGYRRVPHRRRARTANIS